MIRIFTNSINILKKIKPIIFIVGVLTLISLGIGFYLSQSDSFFILNLKNRLLLEIENMKPIQNIAQAILDKNILYAIVYTAIFNTVSGAFLSTTLMGVFFPLPILIMVERGLFIGLLYGDIPGNFFYYLVICGTIILEFGAYVISASLGVNIGLSLFWPQREKTKNRWKAFGKAWREAFKVYPLVILILIVSAIWEIGGLYLLVK